MSAPAKNEDFPFSKFMDIVGAHVGGDDPDRVNRVQSTVLSVSQDCFDYGGRKYCAKNLRRVGNAVLEAAQEIHYEEDAE